MALTREQQKWHDDRKLNDSQIADAHRRSGGTNWDAQVWEHYVPTKPEPAPTATAAPAPVSAAPAPGTAAWGGDDATRAMFTGTYGNQAQAAWEWERGNPGAGSYWQTNHYQRPQVAGVQAPAPGGAAPAPGGAAVTMPAPWTGGAFNLRPGEGAAREYNEFDPAAGKWFQVRTDGQQYWTREIPEAAHGAFGIAAPTAPTGAPAPGGTQQAAGAAQPLSGQPATPTAPATDTTATTGAGPATPADPAQKPPPGQEQVLTDQGAFYVTPEAAAAWRQQKEAFATAQKEAADREFGLKQDQLKLSQVIAAADKAYKDSFLQFQNSQLAQQAAQEAIRMDLQRQVLELQRMQQAQTVSLEQEKLALQRRQMRGRRGASVRYR